MGSHPLNLAVRFILELSALTSIGIWGWKQSDDWIKFVLGIGLPILFAVIWGTFAVPEDPSRSGNAPIVVSGYIRLAIELAIFAAATWALYNIDYGRISLIFGTIVIVHYLVSYDRIIWLFRQ